MKMGGNMKVIMGLFYWVLYTVPHKINPIDEEDARLKLSEMGFEPKGYPRDENGNCVQDWGPIDGLQIGREIRSVQTEI
jgi:hypothetical protein